MEVEQIRDILQAELSKPLETLLDANPKGLSVEKEDLLKVCSFLHTDSRFYFDMLSSITGLDNGEGEGLEVIYHLYSIPNELSLSLSVAVGKEQPVISSVVEVWQTANWHERETYDLLGVVFEGHPDLRRILLPNDWEGHPLRKDYQLQEYYHGIKVEY